MPKRIGQCAVGRLGRYEILAALVIALLMAPAARAQDDDSETLREIGDVLQWALPAAGGTTALIIGDKEGFEQWAWSLGTHIVTVGGIKAVVDKTRPNRGKQSFPSGHTAAAFNGASFIQRRYGWEYGAPAYALAALTGYSRVDATKHDWADVTAGAVIGVASTYIFTEPLEVGDTTLAVAPIFDDDYYGLSFSLGAMPGFSIQDEVPEPEEPELTNRARNTQKRTGTDPTNIQTRLEISANFIDQSGEPEPDAARTTGFAALARFDWAFHEDHMIGVDAAFVRNTAEEFDADGFGDMFLYYTWVPYQNVEAEWWEPRAWGAGVDMILPTGSASKGLGFDTWAIRPKLVGAWTPLENFNVYPTLSYYQSLNEGDFGVQTQLLAFEPMVEYKFHNGVYLYWKPELLYDLASVGPDDFFANHRFQFGVPITETMLFYAEYQLIGRDMRTTDIPEEGRPRYYDDVITLGLRYLF